MLLHSASNYQCVHDDGYVRSVSVDRQRQRDEEDRERRKVRQMVCYSLL